MTTAQKVIKYLAMAFAIFLTVSIIGGLLSSFGFFDGFFSDDAVTEDIKTYSVSADIKSLEIKINAADFTIKQGESFTVESNLKHLTDEDKNGVLTIEETKKYSKTYTGAVLTLYVPAGTVFDRADITTGAGRFTVDQLSAGTMKFELGAGEVTIDTLIATTAIAHHWDLSTSHTCITSTTGDRKNVAEDTITHDTLAQGTSECLAQFMTIIALQGFLSYMLIEHTCFVDELEMFDRSLSGKIKYFLQRECIFIVRIN